MGKKADNRKNLILTDDQLWLAEEFCRRERYRSLSELFVSLLRHQAITQQAHVLTGEWAALSPQERDEIDAGLRQIVEAGTPAKGSALKVAIYDAIKELNGQDAKSPTIDQVLMKLPLTLQRGLAKRKRISAHTAL
jgi:hypothetical protein